MSKQKVKVLTVERSVSMTRRSDGGTYTGTKLVYQDSSGKTIEKPFADVFLEKNQTLDQQLAALVSASKPVDVVLEQTKQTGKDGKGYNQISAILPGNTVIQPGEEVVVSTYQARSGGGNKGSNYSNKPSDFRSSKVLTRTEALRMAVELVGQGSIETVLETARRFETFLHEADGTVSSGTVSTNSASGSASPVTHEAVGGTVPAGNPFKF